MKKIVLCIIFTCFLFGCARANLIKIPCPSHPRLAPVSVIHNTVSGEDLSNTILNFQRLWEHIHKLERLGCTL